MSIGNPFFFIRGDVRVKSIRDGYGCQSGTLTDLYVVLHM
jgi:hypothetical protein